MSSKRKNDGNSAAPTAGLRDFSFIRAFTSRETIHAVGRFIYHPRFPSGRPALTSPVLDIAKDRTWMCTENRIYELQAELEEQPDHMKAGIAVILRGRPPRKLEWLRPDGSVCLRWSESDLLAAADGVFAEHDRLVKALKEKLANETA